MCKGWGMVSYQSVLIALIAPLHRLVRMKLSDSPTAERRQGQGQLGRKGTTEITTSPVISLQWKTRGKHTFLGCCFYFWIFNFNFKFFGLKTLFFKLLHAKPCRTIMKLHQKFRFGPETCEI